MEVSGWFGAGQVVPAAESFGGGRFCEGSARFRDGSSAARFSRVP